MPAIDPGGDVQWRGRDTAAGVSLPGENLCLYGLDILADLWSVLYLRPRRTPGVLSAQAEYQARILPALADQLRLETSHCGHPRTQAPLTGYPRRTS